MVSTTYPVFRVARQGSWIGLGGYVDPVVDNHVSSTETLRIDSRDGDGGGGRFFDAGVGC